MNNSFWGIDLSWVCNLFYHASKGNDEPNSTIRAFTFLLCKILKKQKPTFLVAAIDSHLSFRKDLDPSYKSNRTEKDELYVQQLDQIKQLLDALGIPSLEVDAFEADDVLATLAEEAKKIEIPFVAVIQDKDFRQILSSGKVGMYNKPRGMDWRFFSQKMAEESWGVRVNQMIEWQCLVGDQVDSIRGCDKIGPGKATKLLNRYDTIEGIYENLGELSESMRKNLEIFRPRLEIVRKLVTLVKDAGNFGNVLEHYEVSDFRVNRPELHKILIRNDIGNLENLLLETLNA